MDQEHFSAWEQDTYQTGSTRPPKNRGGLIALLLALVIFLCGVSTALGLMNIRLFRFLQESNRGESAPVSFSDPRKGIPAEDVCFPLGFCGQEIPEFWSLYQDLPRGIYITDVVSGSDAAAKGVLPGDILVQVDGKAVTSADTLTNLLAGKQSPVQAIFYREGNQLQITLSVDN